MKKNTIFCSLILAVLLAMCMLPATATSSESMETNDELVKSYENMKYASITKNFSNALSLKDLDSIREQVVSEYKKEKGISTVPVIYSVPEVPEGGEIIAYCFKINDDGTTSQYVGIAGDKESVSNIHERAKEWYNTEVLEFEEKPVLNSTNQTIDGLISSKGEAEWSRPCYFYDDYYKSPYGGVMNNYEIYVLMNDGSSTRDWFAIIQEFGMEPGYRAYPISPWKNDVGYAYQKWPSGTLGNAQLFKYRPQGTLTGQTSQSVTITGGSGGVSAGLTWGYSQPDVSTECYSSVNTDIAYWKLICNSNAAKTSTVGINPGSTCSADQHSSGDYKILDVKATGIFRENIMSSKILSTTGTPYISYN